MLVVSESQAVHEFIRERSQPGRADCSLVPTMGALHAGHGALIRRGVQVAVARGLAGGCTVTIFVNPTQFDETADFERYPRTLAADLDLCRKAGARTVLVPTPQAVYPAGAEIPVPSLPDQATMPKLEDAARPGHFAGVCQVVARLFEMVRPAAAVFGEKDWQQLCVVAAMARRDWPEISVVGFPIVREPDGLALSSRNRFLTPAQRAAAAALNRSLALAGRATDASHAEDAMRRALEAAEIAVDYAVVRNAHTLGPPESGSGPMRALVAGRLGTVRLLDNSPWPAREAADAGGALAVECPGAYPPDRPVPGPFPPGAIP